MPVVKNACRIWIIKKLSVSFVQDGHGMLPLLSYSFKDSVLIKVFNLAFGLTVGGALFVLGL